MFMQAYMGTKDWVEARSDFQAVLNIDSSNKTAKNQLIIAEHKVKQERERERKLYASMFTKMAAGAGDSKPTQVGTKMSWNIDNTFTDALPNISIYFWSRQSPN